MAVNESTGKAVWLPIESNPEVMNKFLWSCGLSKKWAINDVFGLDEGLLAMLNEPVLALLLCFPITKNYTDQVPEIEAEIKAQEASAIPSSLYYMKQTVSNACGTVALFHAVANNLEKVDLDPESKLGRFFADTKDMSPEERADKLETNKEVSEAHDTVAREGQTAPPNLDDPVEHHFIAFVEVNGCVMELDGRKVGPRNCGKVEGSFVKSAAEQCQNYMKRDPENIGFTMVALTGAE